MEKLNQILDRIISSRKEKEYTQAEVSARLGLARSTYARKELGNIPLTLDELLLIAEFLGMPILSFFVSGRQKKPTKPPNV